MSWIEKSQPTSFDRLPIHGLFFMDGDLVARFLALKYADEESFNINPTWLKGHKTPRTNSFRRVVRGLESSPEAEATIHPLW